MTSGSDTVTITRYYGSNSAVAIPAEIDGKTVTAIEGYAFSNCAALTSLTIPGGVTLNKTALDLKTGESETLKASVKPDNATDKTVTWKSDHTKAATVDNNGNVTAVAPGKATITVTTADGNKTATCIVTVKNPPINFSDVPSGAWYAPYVYDLAEKGILVSKEDGKFAPAGMITRAEFVKILAYASGDEVAPYNKDCIFSDSTKHWSKQNINWAYEHNITKGTSPTTFAPDAYISRQEMAAMIKRYADYKQITLPEKVEEITFRDDVQIASWAKDDVTVMQRATIISGKPGNIFDRWASALRCEAAKMISVFLSL